MGHCLVDAWSCIRLAMGTTSRPLPGCGLDASRTLRGHDVGNCVDNSWSVKGHCGDDSMSTSWPLRARFMAGACLLHGLRRDILGNFCGRSPDNSSLIE